MFNLLPLAECRVHGGPESRLAKGRKPLTACITTFLIFLILSCRLHLHPAFVQNWAFLVRVTASLAFALVSGGLQIAALAAITRGFRQVKSPDSGVRFGTCKAEKRSMLHSLSLHYFL